MDGWDFFQLDTFKFDAVASSPNVGTDRLKVSFVRSRFNFSYNGSQFDGMLAWRGLFGKFKATFRHPHFLLISLHLNGKEM